MCDLSGAPARRGVLRELKEPSMFGFCFQSEQIWVRSDLAFARKMVKRRCLRLCFRRWPVPVRLAGLVFQGLVRASPLHFGVTAVLRLTAQRTSVP